MKTLRLGTSELALPPHVTDESQAGVGAQEVTHPRPHGELGQAQG